MNDFSFLQMIGNFGIALGIGVILFFFVAKYSTGIFDWIEHQTFGTRTYLLEKIEFLNWSINPDYLTILLLSISFGLGGITLLFFGLMVSWILGIVFGGFIFFIGWKIPRPFVNYFVTRRIRAYENQMVDGLTLLANGLRAGLSVPQAVGMVVDEMPAPISQEFRLLLQQNKIGVPLEECFDNLAKRVPTEDNDMFVSSVNILRETGGNLAEVFDTIIDIIRERIRLKQKIETLTAQGLFQGATIFAIPFIMGGFYFVSDPDSMVTVFTNPLGIILMFIALLLDLIGGYIILKIVSIKV